MAKQPEPYSLIDEEKILERALKFQKKSNILPGDTIEMYQAGAQMVLEHIAKMHPTDLEVELRYMRIDRE